MSIPLIIKKAEALHRDGGNLQIYNYVTKDHSNTLGFAYAELEGYHEKTINSDSDRAYYIIEGSGKVMLNEETYVISDGDSVFIPKNTIHGLDGNLKYLVINSPPYDPQYERLAEDS